MTENQNDKNWEEVDAGNEDNKTDDEKRTRCKVIKKDIHKEEYKKNQEHIE